MNPAGPAPDTGATPGQPQATFMHIGEVATRTDLSLRSLRHWEEVGLLQPSGRTEGGFRLYTEDDVAKILLIRRMKPLGFSLDQMKEALLHLETLRYDEAPAAARDEARLYLEQLRESAIERRAVLTRQVEMADEFIALITTPQHPGKVR